MQTDAHKYMPTHAYTHIQTHTHANTRTCKYIDTHTNIYMYMHTHVLDFSKFFTHLRTLTLVPLDLILPNFLSTVLTNPDQAQGPSQDPDLLAGTMSRPALPTWEK